jgi:uncharacterized protein (TIGR02466 family)
LTYRIEPTFVTPIYASFVSDFPKIKCKIDNVIDKVNFSYKSEWGKTHLLSDTDFRENIISKLRLKCLSNEIDKHVRNYCDELNFEYKRYKMTSWIAKFQPGDFAHIHEHGHSDISGVFYYKTNEDDGDLVFTSPNPFLKTSKLFAGTELSWIHKPIEGKILLFPGWIPHGVKTNETDNTRISISFNINFEN